jgi:hypothetical protein
MGNLLEAEQDLGVVESHGVTLTDDDEQILAKTQKEDPTTWKVLLQPLST